MTQTPRFSARHMMYCLIMLLAYATWIQPAAATTSNAAASSSLASGSRHDDQEPLLNDQPDRSKIGHQSLRKRCFYIGSFFHRQVPISLSQLSSTAFCHPARIESKRVRSGRANHSIAAPDGFTGLIVTLWPIARSYLTLVQRSRPFRLLRRSRGPVAPLPPIAPPPPLLCRPTCRVYRHKLSPGAIHLAEGAATGLELTKSTGSIHVRSR